MDYQKKILDNGIRLVTVKKEGVDTVTVLVLCHVGSRYENDAERGLSHFVEHMMFKGTPTRSTNMDVTMALDSVGADYNAFTTRECTGYYVKVDKDKIELALDVLGDVIFNSKIDAEELTKEKGVILEEIKMYEENPLMYLEDVFEELVFLNSRLGQLVIGTRERIAHFTREEVFDYWNKFYQSNEIVVVVAGNFDPVKTEAAVVKNFINHVSTTRTGHNNYFEKFVSSAASAKKVSIFFKESEQAQLGLGVLGYDNRSELTYPLTVLNVIMGATMSSRLFNEVREKRGLAYSIHSRSEYYEDTGCFYVQAGVAVNKIDEAIKVIISELEKVRDTGVTAPELNMAKEFIKGRISIQMEDTSEVANWFAKQELLSGKILTPEEKIKKYFQINSVDISYVAKELLRKNAWRLALIGPFKDENHFEKLIS